MRVPVKRIGGLMLLSFLPIHASPLMADGARDIRRSYFGMWAGERMMCEWPAGKRHVSRELHVYGPHGTRHPAVFQDSPSYACKVLKVQGRWPQWTLELSCTSFGVDNRSETLRASQMLTLLEGGNVLRMQMISQRGDELWADDLHWCRPLRTRPPLKRIH